MRDNEAKRILAFLEGRTPKNQQAAIEALEARGADVPNLLLQKYRVSRRWSDRATCVDHCSRYASESADAIALGIAALDDRSRLVRQKACFLLARSRNAQAIEHLRRLLSNPASAADAQAAIDTLANLDHNQ